MTKCLKTMLELLLTAVLLISALPFTASAATAMTVTVETKNAMAGSIVNLDVKIGNNPGFAAISLDIDYDKTNLTLKGFSYNDTALAGASTTPYNADASTPCLYVVNGSQNITGDFTLATLTFEVKATAKNNTSAYVKLTYDPENVYNIKEQNISCNITNGAVNIIACVPGDINGDEKVNSKDVSRLMQYHAHWDVDVNEPALDTNGDGKLNSKDVTRLMQYLAHWDVDLYPLIDTDEKNLTAIEAVPATCEDNGNIAYWINNATGKCYKDSKGLIEISLGDTVIPAIGHTPVIDSAVPATYEHTGLTEGSHCSVCGKVLEAQIIIPVLQATEYSITYYVSNNDNYLKQQSIDNPNPGKYSKEKGLVLRDLFVDGYNFKGWYTSQTGGNLVTNIVKGTTGDLVLYAHWEKVSYTVTFDSPDVPVSNQTYTVDTGLTLRSPSWFGYTFVGWSQDGEIVTSIPTGTTGNITLHANWTSNRNKAKAKSRIDDPDIIEDLDKAQYLFVYEIGTIENVPLNQIAYLGNTDGINITKEYEYSKSIGSAEATKVAKAVSNATTKTSSWTLSDEWNQTTSAVNENEEQRGKTQQKTDREGNVVNSKYYVSNSSGGSTSSSSSSGGTSDTSAKVTRGTSVGINGSYTASGEVSASVGLSTTDSESKTKEWGIGGNIGYTPPSKTGGIGGGISGNYGRSTTNVHSETLETEIGMKASRSATIAGERTQNVGTDQAASSGSHWDTSSSSSSNWNTTSGYENSSTVSRDTELSNTISEMVRTRYAYTSTDSEGGSSSTSQSSGDSQELRDEYTSTVEYSTEERETVRKSLTLKSDASGYYRLVNAGTIHVFAVVGYDLATNSYYTYTYNILDSDTHEYLDYSKDNANFNDCENAVIPFEIPYAVHEFISAKIARTKGLEFDYDTGMITGFDNSTIDSQTGEGEYIIIPEYVSLDNGDGTRTAVRVRGIDADTFKGNTKIKGVFLPKYISEIPDSAFEGCTSLRTVIGYGITDIGNNAFKGCTSLVKFSIDKNVTHIGQNAFYGCPEIVVSASSASIADATIHSGAKRITLNISDMNEGEAIDGKVISVESNVDYFALQSTSKNIECKNVSIDSQAKETVINNIKFTENRDTVLKISSPELTLNRVTVENAPGFALVMSANNTNVKLYGGITLSSKGENTVISKNVSLSKMNTEVAGSMNITGNYLICGTASNSKLLKFTNGELKTISADQFDEMLSSIVVTFDSNGGNALSENTKIVYYGQLYGDMPTPTRTNYDFVGWYTEKSGGDIVSSETSVSSLANQTLYAHWSAKKFTVTFNANGGVVSTEKKIVTYGKTYGELPTPTQDYKSFTGWFTQADGGTQITAESKATTSSNRTLYAHWEDKPTSDWTLASQMPANAKVVDNKWSYTLREYSESGSSSKDGWSLLPGDDGKKRTDWGAWSDWVYSNPSNGVRDVTSEQYISGYGTKQIYVFYWWSSSYNGNPAKAQISGYPNYYTKEIDYYPSNTSQRPIAYYNGTIFYRWEGNNWYYCWFDHEYSTTDYNKPQYSTRWKYRNPIYTYYFYRDLDKEAISDPTGQENVSNVQKWVKYIEK